MNKKGREDKLDSQSAAFRLWRRRSGVFAGYVKTDRDAATGRQKRSTERLVYLKGRPSREGWRAAPPPSAGRAK